MKIIIWNCQGLRNPQAIPVLYLLVKQHNPNMVVLVETKLKVPEFNNLKKKTGFQNGFRVDSEDRIDGIGILWRDGLDVEILKYYSSFIDTKVNDKSSNNEWRFTFFYWVPNLNDRHRSWTKLRGLFEKFAMLWLIGDFNEIFDQDKKIWSLSLLANQGLSRCYR